MRNLLVCGRLNCLKEVQCSDSVVSGGLIAHGAVARPGGDGFGKRRVLLLRTVSRFEYLSWRGVVRCGVMRCVVMRCGEVSCVGFVVGVIELRADCGKDGCMHPKYAVFPFFDEQGGGMFCF